MGVAIALGVFAALYFFNRTGASSQAPIDWNAVYSQLSNAVSEVSTTVTDSLDKFAQAITHFEGQPGDLNYRNNNPGNLMFAGQPGAIGADSRGLAIFETWAEGLAALKRQLALDASRYPQWSIFDYISNKYAPSGPDNPNDVNYANSIASALGVTANTKLGDLGLIV